MTSFRDYLDNATTAESAVQETQLRAAALPKGAASFQGERAGLVTRVLAAVIDVLVVFGIVLLIAFAVWMFSFIFTPISPGLTAQGSRRIPPPIVLVAIGYAIAFVYFTVSWASSGRTIGNLVMGVRVIDYRGQRLAWWAAVLRSAFVIVFPLGLFWVIVSGANRSVQDVVLRTSVIYDWVVGLPSLSGILGRNRAARASS